MRGVYVHGTLSIGYNECMRGVCVHGKGPIKLIILPLFGNLKMFIQMTVYMECPHMVCFSIWMSMSIFDIWSL